MLQIFSIAIFLVAKSCLRYGLNSDKNYSQIIIVSLFENFVKKHNNCHNNFNLANNNYRFFSFYDHYPDGNVCTQRKVKIEHDY